MPGYGDMASGAARGFYWCTAGGLEVRREYQEGSLLAQNMNRLWCSALNEKQNGTGPDYFAMQHSDVQADDYWLDDLVDELETRHLDLLGVVIPIKDRLGITTTALARPDGHNWRVHARLSMQEVFRLPETFTSEDVGYDLLLNTGLWVCKFDMAWAPKVWFEIQDRIRVDGKGRYHPINESEDWFFSRLCQEIGLKIGATRKVRVGHIGKAVYGNVSPWGEWDRDRFLVESPVVPAAQQEAFDPGPVSELVEV